MEGLKLYTLIVVIVVYGALLFWKSRRTEALWVGVLALLVGKVLGPGEAITAVEWNVMGIFAGILLLAESFADSGVPLRIADQLIDRSKTIGMAILWICLFSGFVSIFVENVATVLIVAPVALETARRAKVSPVPFPDRHRCVVEPAGGRHTHRRPAEHDSRELAEDGLQRVLLV